MTQPERKRLDRSNGAAIRAAFEKAGFKVRQQAQRIFLWDDKTFVGEVAWVTHVGWRLYLAHPVLHTPASLDEAVDHLKVVRRAVVLSEEKWRVFARTKSEKAWQAYMGVLAAHHMGQFATGEVR